MTPIGKAEAPSRRERRRSETRNRLVAAAVELFTRQGFHKTTVEQITEAADVAKGTFFNHFPSKEAVVDEMAYSTLAGLSAVADAVQQAPTVRPVLAMLPDRLVHGIARSDVFLRSLIGTQISCDESAPHFAELAAVARQQIARIVVRGQQIGEIRSDRSADELARALQQVVWGTLLLWCIGDPADIRERLTVALEIFWNGAAAPALKAKEQPV